MKRLLSGLLATVLILTVLYFVTVNVALNVTATRDAINRMQPERLALSWNRAWSLYPLRVQLHGLSADGQTPTEQWQLDAARAGASVSLLPLLRGEIVVHDLDLRDIDLRLRPRPTADDDHGGMAAFFPVIRNRDPNALAEPIPEQEPLNDEDKAWQYFDELRFDGRVVPDGAWVVRMDQPFRPFVEEMLGETEYPRTVHDGETVRPYDVTAWRLSEMLGVEVLAVEDRSAVEALLGRYDLVLETVDLDDAIPGSFWGEEEAGLQGNRLLARPDTPVHSVLHEACHYVCMTPARRKGLDTDAGGDYEEENGVCFLQILLADHLPGFGRDRMMRDMDAWGYCFRLGSAREWFEGDADDAQAFLASFGLIDREGRPTWKLRETNRPGP